MPAFFNAHTHVGDTVAMDLPVTGALEELVTPPNGLKPGFSRGHLATGSSVE